MIATWPAPGDLRPNPNWASLPIFDRRGWRRLPFGKFADSINERVDPAYAAEEIYVGLEHLDPENLHIRRWGKGSDVIGTKLRFYKGDIIFGRRRAYQRKLAVAEFDGICSAHAMVVRAKPEVVLPEFLPFLMMSDRFMNRAVEISVGSLSPTINWKTLKKEEFDLPPLEQQRRIAEVLWAVDEVSCCIEKLQSSIEYNIQAERNSFFNNAKQERIKHVGELFEVQLGKMLSPKSKQGNSPYPYLGNKNVQWGSFDLTNVQTMDFSPDEFEKFKLQKGDLLVCEGGEVGRSAIWNGQVDDCCYQKALHRLRPLDGSVSTEYMLEFMIWANSHGLFSSLTGHSTIAHLTAIKLKRLAVPVANQMDEEAFLTRMCSMKEILKAILSHREQVVLLRSSLLQYLVSCQ